MRYHFNNILIHIPSPESGWENDLPTVVVQLLIVIIIRHEKFTFIECLLYIGHHWKCLKRVRGTDYSLHLFHCQGMFTQVTPPALLRPFFTSHLAPNSGLHDYWLLGRHRGRLSGAPPLSEPGCLQGAAIWAALCCYHLLLKGGWPLSSVVSDRQVTPPVPWQTVSKTSGPRIESHVLQPAFSVMMLLFEAPIFVTVFT